MTITLNNKQLQKLDKVSTNKAVVRSIRNYVEKHEEPGGFVQAVLKNDLVTAVTRNDSTDLKELVRWLYNQTPAISWGSEVKYKQWIAQRPRQRLNIR